MVVPPPRPTPASESKVRALVEGAALLPHQKVLVFDEQPRVGTAQRLERAALLRAPAVVAVRSDGSAFDKM